jgi:hypothetical protein
MSIRFKQLFPLLMILVMSVGCATKNRKAHDKVREAVSDGRYKEALEYVQGDDFYPEKNSLLVKLLEIGMIQHLNGNHHQAIMTFDKAKEVSDELFTVSVSKKLASAVMNANVDHYYGTPYERSMIRFYQVLSHYLLYLKGEYEAYEVIDKDEKGKILNVTKVPAKKLENNERRFHLSAARSTLLEWNSLLDTYKAETGGKPVYKDDLLAKIFGAYIHEQVGSSDDMRIALSLYKEAKKVLFRNFNMLPSYNKKHKEFVDNFKSFANMDEAVIAKQYVDKTPAYLSLESYLDGQIARLSSKKQKSVLVLIENGLISPKRLKKFEFPLPVSSIPATVPANEFMAFTAGVFRVATKTIPKIYFELPEIPYAPVIDDQVINVLDETGNVVATGPLATLNPMTDLASYVLNDEAMGRYAAVGLRVGAKHIAALLSAYALYKKQQPMNEMLAMTVASSAYLLATKGIAMSEEADLRGWNMLPHMYSSAAFDLRPGKYQVEYVNGKTKKMLGSLAVEDGKTAFFTARTR